MRPIVGILSTYCEETQEDYVRAIESAGGSPIIINKVEGLKTFEPIIKVLDGIIFTGGADISPSTYNEMPQAGLRLVDPERDEFELVLAKWILLNTSIPILGICRGMQILNVADGGSLYQNLLKQKPTKSNHWLKSIFPKDEPSHIVNINKPSKLYDIFEKEKMMVNSFHHQGIKKIGKSYKVIMTSEDDVIEAIEMKEERFVVGVQWHPEMLIEKYPEFLLLFRSFIQFCKNNKMRGIL